MDSYVLLLILNLITLVINNNHILVSTVIAAVWGKLFIKNDFVLSLLILGTLFMNTTATYIMKYNYNDKRVTEKIPKYIYFISLLLSLAFYNLDINKKMVNDNLLLIKVMCFVLIFYVISSFLEYYIHKNVMHCDVNGSLNKILKNSILTRITFFDLCENHINHHKEVKLDMKLSGAEIEGSNGLFMKWDVVIYEIIILSIILIPINHFVFKFKIVNVFMVIVIASLFWCYLWNKTHPQMHESLEKIYINEGPIEHKTNFQKVTNMLLDNHKNHHLQKGKKKGNYNIILLGADEWLNKNVTEVDNTEYCKTHKSEHVCK
jgi:hypothetical protein